MQERIDTRVDAATDQVTSPPSPLTDQELEAIAARVSTPGEEAGLAVLRAVAEEAARRAERHHVDTTQRLHEEVDALSDRLARMRHALTEACEEAARAFTRAHDALEADAALSRRAVPNVEEPSDEQLGRLVYEAIVSASKLHTAQRKVFRPWAEANDTVRAANIGAARAVRQRLESVLKRY